MRHCTLIGDATGDNRLTIAVASKLVEDGATVVLVVGSDQAEADAVRAAVGRSVTDQTRADIEARALSARPVVLAIALGRAPDLEHSLHAAVAMAAPHRLLALSLDFEQNLRVAVVARRVVSKVPVILRSFDPDFGHQIENAADGERYVERAYSVAHLSAPSFVAAALLNDPQAHQLTMRVGIEYVSVCRIKLLDAAQAGKRIVRGRALVGRTPNEIVDDEGCQVLARSPGNDAWACANGSSDVPLAPGEEILLGGPMTDVMNLAIGRATGHRRSRRPRSVPGAAVHGVTLPRRASMRARVAQALSRTREGVAGARLSTLWVAGLALVMTAATLWLSLGTVPGQVFYKWVGTALGNAGDKSDSQLGYAVAAVGLATGGIMLGLLTSMMSAWFVRERIVEDVRRRAKRMKDHVIIVGLDDVGIQVAALLRKLGVRSSVVVPGAEGPTDPIAPDRRLQRLAKHTPVLTGELVEMLDHARIDRAQAVVACTESNLVDLQACMRAKRGDSPTDIRVIARIFNDADAETAAETFKIDHHIAAVDVAASAFADAALQEGARSLRDTHGDLSLRSVVWHGDRCVGRDEMERWHESGIRLLALLRGRRLQALPVEPQGLACGDLAVLAGPEDALKSALQTAR
jgi:Trk K+ transport system NAD-binding subunit